MTEPELEQPEAVVEDEPCFAGRQKPAAVRRQKVGRRGGSFYRRVIVAGVAVVAGGGLAYQTVHFVLFSPRLLLARPDQIQVTGTHYLGRAAVLEKFYADRGRSVLRIPLAERRKALEEIPWVERASVQRILPNTLRVEIVQRQPVAFLRLGTELSLLDAHGVILERPPEEAFRFPVVTGITAAMPAADRGQRMKTYEQFLKEIERARPGAADQVSEVDLSDANDIRATLAGMPELGDPQAGGQQAVVVRFGDANFFNKYRVLMDNLSQWRANAGRIESVDLRFERQVVVKPEGGRASAQNLGRAGPAQRRQ